MSLIRRFTALLSSLLLFQLSVLGGGSACVSHGGGRHETMGASAVQRAHVQHPRSSTDDCGARNRAGACVSMPSCTTLFSTPTAVVAAIATAPTHAVLPETTSPLSEPAAGPTVPPPRA